MCSGFRSRFKITKNGKVLRMPAGKRHGMSAKHGAQLRRLSRKWVPVSTGMSRHVRLCMPYGSTM